MQAVGQSNFSRRVETHSPAKLDRRAVVGRSVGAVPLRQRDRLVGRPANWRNPKVEGYVSAGIRQVGRATSRALTKTRGAGQTSVQGRMGNECYEQVRVIEGGG